MFPHLGLKASTDPQQVNERLGYHPDVFEFYTDRQDVTDSGLVHLTKMIRLVQDQGIQHIVIHHPMRFGKFHNELFVDATKMLDQYDFLMAGTERLINLALQENVQLLVHGAYNEPLAFIHQFYPSVQAAQALVFKRLDYFAALGGDHIMFENSISPVFAYGDAATEALVIQKKYRLCFDVSHAFIYNHGDNTKLQASLKRLAPQIVHYHLVDSMGLSHDSLPLGQGNIDWAKVYPLLNQKATNIFEINLKNQLDSKEMRDSYQYLLTIQQNLAH